MYLLHITVTDLNSSLGLQNVEITQEPYLDEKLERVTGYTQVSLTPDGIKNGYYRKIIADTVTEIGLYQVNFFLNFFIIFLYFYFFASEWQINRSCMVQTRRRRLQNHFRRIHDLSVSRLYQLYS